MVSSAWQACQTRRDYLIQSKLEGGTPDNLFDGHIEPFLKHLRAAGYAERTLRKKRTVARAFARWMKRKQTIPDYAASVSIDKKAGRLEVSSTRHNPGV